MGLQESVEEHTVLWLDDPACADARRVGGKAAQLSRLATFHRVPPGFCLPAATLNHLLHDITSRPTLHTSVSGAYGRLAQRTGVESPRVAVRSSALDEDGELTSFAGQHETYLNLVGPDQIVDALLRCWESGQSDRARIYRQHHQLSLDDLQLAVLVQHLVLADVSVVAFSANPVSGDRDEVVVTASYGLGESIVSGTVTPDTWIMRKSDGSLLNQEIGAKERMTVVVPDGTQEVDVPRLLRGHLSLTQEQVNEVTDLAISLDQRMGWPVDIECAFADESLYLLQCRPITTRLSKSA